MSVLEGGPQVNKFEQVSSDGHQMSLARGPHVSCLEVCTVRSNTSWVIVTWGPLSPPEQNDRQTLVKTFPSLQFRWRVMLCKI